MFDTLSLHSAVDNPILLPATEHTFVNLDCWHKILCSNLGGDEHKYRPR